jgi:muconolactone D-isomerase
MLTVRSEAMEYLVEFVVHVPEGTPELLVTERTTAEAAAAADLADQGHLARLWKLHDNPGEVRALGLFRAANQTDVDALLAGLPLYEWMDVTVIPLDAHPNDPRVSQGAQALASPGDETRP